MGFNLTCIKCGNQGEISLDMDDLKTFRCRQCDDEFTAEDIAEVIGEWKRALDWINVGADATDAIRMTSAATAVTAN